MNILFLSQWFPFPANNGSKLRIYNLLRGLSEHHEVTLLSFTDQANTNLASPEFRAICREVHVVAWRPFNPHSQRARMGFLNPKPRFLIDIFSEEMDRLVRDSISRKKYDLVIASQLSMASYFPSFRDIPALFDEIELGLFHDNAVHARSLRPRIRNGLTWLKLRKYLARVLDAFRFCTVASERERQLFAENFPEHETKVRLIPNCIDIKDYRGLETERTPRQLIFPGSFRYYSNYEAMKWFTGDVFPKILKRMPETRLVITGDHGGQSLPPVPNVTLTGEVQDIKSLIASSWISVAPLLSGGGTRLKILEAMALGTPVVSTSKGMEGLAAVPGEHLLLADSAQVFAEHVITLLQDTNLHGRLSANGRQLVKEKYDWEVAMPRFLELVENAAR